jgi:predicted HTH transcriptional regulator
MTMMNRTIEKCLAPKYGLLMFPKFSDLQRWVFDNMDDIRSVGATYYQVTHKLVFPNGNILLLGHDPEDFLPYMGCRFTFVDGTTDERYQALIES